MPASTLDPVNAALRTALTKTDSENTLDSQLVAGSTKKALLSDIEFEPAGNYQTNVLNKLKTKYIVLKGTTAPQASKPEEDMGASETLKLPKFELYPLESVQLGWNNCDWSVGAGMVNMGNTCYLNSTLQALFHVPALANWLMSDKKHATECQDSGGMCIICAMRKTLQDSQQRNANSIRPSLIYKKLLLVCRNLIPGGQEDAHEFLRYLVEAMEKAYLGRFKNHTTFDSKVKETTPLNQILGGYLRSAVRCLKCGHVSTTFEHFQDLLLDISKTQTLDEALELYFSREELDDKSYQCEGCQKKVLATKQFSLERAPMVLCIQLKRFSVSNNKITKHVTFRQRLDLTKYARHRPNIPLIYRLVALVTHMGPTVRCGHYTAVAQAPCGNFYQFDDSMVRPISHQAVFNTNAYIMLYELESSPFAQKTATINNKIKSNNIMKIESVATSSNNCSKLNSNGIGFTSDKVYGPQLPPGRLNGSSMNGNSHSSSTTSSSSDEEYEENEVKTPVNTEQQGSCKSPLKPLSLNHNNVAKNGLNGETVAKKTTVVTKLVPYESDDTSASEDSNQSVSVQQHVEIESSRVVTKATPSEWKVTSSTDQSQEPSSSEGLKGKSENSDNEWSKSLRDGGGYTAVISTWNGTKSQLNKESGSEKGEDRKRALSDSFTEPVVKAKQAKVGNYKSNPGYNPIQEFHSAKKWKHRGNYKSFYNSNRHRRNFAHKNFHNRNVRYRQ